MAGRGCTISITILGGGGGEGGEGNEEMFLPVALHSPLSVLKDQLQPLTGIATRDQVLILCDLSDEERNSDTLLEGRDNMSLRDCGIRNGSILTVHALGMSAEKQQKMAKEALTRKEKAKVIVESRDREEDLRRTITTKITASQANHSYNGVIFDVQSNGPYELNLISIAVGGMLGRVTVHARDKPWEADKPTKNSSPHWWAHRESVSKDDWTLVADVFCRPSWDKLTDIVFDRPVRVLPLQKIGLYIHSGLPDDLGIQYQSYPSKDSIVAQDQFITLLPGLGHTGSVPFDDTHGWYRAWRGLAGAISYKARWFGWSPFQHRLFPKKLKEAVMTMLLCQHHVVTEEELALAAASEENENAFHRDWSSSLSSSSSPTALSSSWSSSSASATSSAFSAASASASVFSASSATASATASSATASASSSDPIPAATVTSRPCRSMLLHRLPRHIIYNVLEFMHYDWFIETEEAAEERRPHMSSSDGDARSARDRLYGLGGLGMAGGGPGPGTGGRISFLHLAQLLSSGAAEEPQGLQALLNHVVANQMVPVHDDEDDDDDEEQEEDDDEDDLDDANENEAEEDDESPIVFSADLPSLQELDFHEQVSGGPFGLC